MHCTCAYRRCSPVLAAILVAPLAIADTIRVPGEYPAIQMALDAARPGDVVLVADGVWTGSRNINLNMRGKAVTVRSENGPANCVIAGDRQGTGFLFITGETAESRVEGFTIRECNRGEGGAIYIENAGPTIENCIMENNWAGATGGAINCKGRSAPTIRNCVLRNNLSGIGGGLYADGASPTLIDCTISGNRTDIIGAGGAGVVRGGVLTMIGCTVTENTAMGFAGNGGGVQINGASAVLRNCAIVDNHGTLYGGGVICVNAVSAKIENCTIADNLSDADGGGIYFSGGRPVVIDSIVWGNFPDAILVASGAPVVTYSDIEGGFGGEGNIDRDPRFVEGPRGGYYLAEREAGQPATSPCVDAGSDTAENRGLAQRTTRTDDVPDRGTVDMGYHHPTGAGEIDCDRIQRVKVRCKGREAPFKISVKISSTLNEGTVLTMTLDGGEARRAVIGGRGQAKAKWPGIEAGPHEVCIVECPDECRQAACG